jgi:uncharacterized protein (DUF1697 family)
VTALTCENARVPTYVALLRGINVGGHQKIRMADLRTLMERLGHVSVETYLQSGNAVFRSSRKSDAALASAMEEAIAAELGLTVSVLVRTGAELARVVDGTPYGDRGADMKQLHVAFLSAAPTAAAVKKLDAAQFAPDELEVAGREVYLHYPDGLGRSKLTNAVLERRLGVAATMRNWRTVTTLAELAAGG